MLNVTDCGNCVFQIQSESAPQFTKTVHSTITCINFSYTEMYHLLILRNINPWNNKWSNFKHDNLSSVTPIYDINRDSKELAVQSFKDALVNQELPNFNQYYPIPYSHGVSSLKEFVTPIHGQHKHLLLVLDQSEDHQTICDLCRLSNTSQSFLIATSAIYKKVEKSKLKSLNDMIKEVISKEEFEVQKDVFNKFNTFLCDEDFIVLIWIICLRDEIVYDIYERFNNTFEERIGLIIDSNITNAVDRLNQLVS